MGENRFSFFPISRHFLSFLLFLDTFSLILDPKVSRNRRKRFLPFIDTFGSKIREKVYRNRRNDKKSLEMGMVQKASLTRGPNDLLDV